MEIHGDNYKGGISINATQLYILKMHWELQILKLSLCEWMI